MWTVPRLCCHASQSAAVNLSYSAYSSSLFVSQRGIVVDSTTNNSRAQGSCNSSAAVHSDTGRRLQCLVWRAKEALLGAADENTTHTLLLERLRVISTDKTTGLFNVEWRGTHSPPEGVRQKSTRSSSLTLSESITLICELLAVTLKGRKGGAVLDFFSADAAMIAPPLKAVESVMSPLGRQARLWGELQEWHELIACVKLTFERVARESVGEDALRDTVRGFFNKLDALCLPVQLEPARGKWNEKRMSSNIPHDTLPNTLWRLAMLCRVMEGILLYPQSHTKTMVLSSKEGFSGDADAEKNVERWTSLGRLEVVVRSVLHEMAMRRFVIRDPTAFQEPLEGLEALLVRAFHHQCGGSERDEKCPRAYRLELADALLSFCAAYFKIIPFCLSTPETKADNDALSILRVVHQFWVLHQRSVHLRGVRGAFWWLRLVPVVYEGFSDVTAQMNGEQHVGRAGSSHLEAARSELLDMLGSMLYFDEKTLEERKAALLTHRLMDEPNSSKIDDGEESGGDPQFGRPRGGRSLFKKDSEDGVLLPRSTDGTHMSSRFSSRRAVLGVVSRGVGFDTNLRPGDKALMIGAAANSPLLEVIATSKDAVTQLSDMFAVDVPQRSCALESMWLALLMVHRRMQENGLPAGLPPFVSRSVQHLAASLAAALLRVYELADSLYTRDGNIRRAVGLAIVTGTQEMLLQNRFYLDTLRTNWWLRSGATLLISHDSRLSVEVEGKLINLLAQRTRHYRNLDWLKHSTATALSCLNAAPLSLVTKQWAGALVLSNVRAVTHLLRVTHHHGRSKSNGESFGDFVQLQEQESIQLQKWACHAFSSLLNALTADSELLLLCGYASFIDTLLELHFRLGTDQQELMQFGDKVLLKTILPALVTGLSKSAEEEDPESHAASCECALFVLAELSRFASWPEISISSVLRNDDNNLLVQAAVYCLRHARRGGGKRASGYGLPEARLPALKPMHLIKYNSATITFLLAKGNRCSYLHVLDLSNRLLPFSRVQPLFDGHERGCITALQHYLQRFSCASSSVREHNQLLEESVKCLSFMASTSISAHVLGYLVRFIEHYLREQERLSRAPLEGFAESAATGGSMQRENAMSSLAQVEAAPLVLLDYMGHLSSAGSWAMVNWAFNLAETSLKIQRRCQLATTVSVSDVATKAILSQLRTLPLLPAPRLPHNLLKSIICLSDMMSESPVTLLGFDRGTPMQGLLKHATRGEYRTMFFALKQAVVLVQRASVKYRGSSSRRVSTGPSVTSEEPALAPAVEVEGEEAAQYGLEDDDEQEEEGKYFSASFIPRSAEEQRQFRVFLDCLVVCFDGVLDTIRWCALQQDILDDELREVLLLTLQTLFHVLQGCVHSVLQVPHASRKCFHEERAHLLLVSLVAAGLVGKVLAADYRRVCFTGSIRQSTDSLLYTVKQLVEDCINSRATGRSGGKVKEGNSLQLVSMLTTSLRSVLSDLQVSHRIALRFGIAMRQRTDLTALIMAVRTLAAASLLYRPAGSLVQQVWRRLCEELTHAGNLHARKGKRNVDENLKLLRVPSKEELKLLVESFRDLETEIMELVESRKARGWSADYVVEWACENVTLILDSVGEDTSVLPHGALHTRNAVTHDRDNEEGGEGCLSFDSGTDVPVISSRGEGGTPTGMDPAAVATALLEEGENFTNTEAVEMLIGQSRGVQMSSGLVAVNDAVTAIPQTTRVLLTHFDCLMTILNRCTLTEIMVVPRAEIIFGCLELFFRRRSPVSPEKCRNLWMRLSGMWKEEFLLPESLLFEQQQCELLQLVRQRRSIIQLGYKEGESALGTSVIPLFSVEDNVMAQLAMHDASPVMSDVALPSHDDISGLLAERNEREPRRKKRHVRKGKNNAPLEVLVTLLGVLSRAPRGEPALEDLGRILVIYVARRYVLLRQRSEGNAVNVMQFLRHSELNSSRVYQRRRLPLECSHAASVAGWFLSAADRQAVDATIVEANDGVNVFQSSEHAVFEYMRSSCLYLHLLALSANLCQHFRIFGNTDADDTDAKGGRQRHVCHGSDEDRSEGTSRSGLPSNRQQHVDVQLTERQRIADARQTDAESVNANLLENILLHFLNVSLAVMHHSDFIMHRAISIAVAPNTNNNHARQALLFADELRLMVVVTMQDTLRLLLRNAPLGFSLARRVAHRIICSFSCEDIPMSSLNSSSGGGDGETRQGRGATSVAAFIDPTALEMWRSKRPELFLRSPTLLSVLSPSFFNEVLSQHLRSAMSLTITQVVSSLHFYLHRPDAHLAPLMAATTNILSSTYVRNAALRLFCEEFCGQIVRRSSFRDALAPPTVASLKQETAGSVPNEVLIPFLASISREDVFVTKSALATVLYHSMSSRPDVFGQPPTADRFARFAITRKSGGSGGEPTTVTSTRASSTVSTSFSPDSRSVATTAAARVVGTEGLERGRLSLGISHTDVVLESPLTPAPAAVPEEEAGRNGGDSDEDDEFPSPAVGDEELEDVELLSRFKPDQADQTATLTHKRALASLNLTLAEVMETGMHFALMRRLTAEEYKKARAMIHSADDARHERIAAFRSASFPTASQTSDGAASSATDALAGYPDTALHLEEPMHFGVALLHIRFALRKIIHASMRRLAAQQGPRTLSMMVEMLREIDPKWHRGRNEERRRQSDGMLAGTLRVLVAHSLVCVELAGGAGDQIGGGAGGIAMSAVGLQRTEQALYLVQRYKHSKRNGNGSGSRHQQQRRSSAAGHSSVARRSPR